MNVRDFLEGVKNVLRPIRVHARFSCDVIRLRHVSVGLNLPLSGPALVLGSAPGASMPRAFSEDWTLISVNASQVVAERWGLSCPDVTFLQPFVLAGTSSANRSARAKLRGRHTRHLIAVHWDWYKGDWRQDLAAIGYTYDTLTVISSLEQARAVYEETGLYCGIRPRHRRMSSGVAAAVFAVRGGGDPVVLSGFSFSCDGHAYDDGKASREHVEGDRAVLDELGRRGRRIFAADRAMAGVAGLELFPQQVLALSGA